MYKKYDFETVIDRTGLDSAKWERIPIPGAEVKEGYDKIPMWVADMDFATAPSVIAAIQSRLLASQSFGYYDLAGTGYHEAIKKWQKERNNVDIEKDEYITYENSVLGGVANVINLYTKPGDPILVQAPTYVGFTGTIAGANRTKLLNPMFQDEEGTYRIDFEDLEQKIIDNDVKVAIFCNPHNPTGRVWEKWEIEKYVEVCTKHNVKIISDEIWSDFMTAGIPHTPTQSVSELARQSVVALYAPSKTFNLAGLVGAYSVIYNDEMRAECKKAGAATHYNLPNLLSAYALVGAYNEGGEWADELIKVISKNFDYAYDFIQNKLPGVEVQRPQGTYIMFLDFKGYLEKSGKTLDEVLERTVNVGVICQDGRTFHGETHMRLNFATPFSQIVKAFDRLDKLVVNGEW